MESSTAAPLGFSSLSGLDCAPHRRESLTTAQAIGIGVAVGFVGASVLYAFVTWIARSAVLAKAFSPRHKPSSAQTSSDHPAPNVQPVSMPRLTHIQHIPIPGVDLESLDSPRNIYWGIDWLPSVYNWGYVFFDYLGCIGYSGPPRSEVEPFLNEDKLVRLAGAPVNGGTWTELISNDATRAAAIVCFVSQILIERIHPSCDIEKTLLPLDMITFYNELLQWDPHWYYREARLDQYLAAWRQVTARFYLAKFEINPERRVCSWGEGNDPRKERADLLISEILDALPVEVTKNHNAETDEIVRVLRGIVLRAASDGIILLAQPSEWTYHWTPKRPGFVVTPGIQLTYRSNKINMFACTEEGWPLKESEAEPTTQGESVDAAVGE